MTTLHKANSTPPQGFKQVIFTHERQKPIPTRKGHSCPLCGDSQGKCRFIPNSSLHLCMNLLDAALAPSGWTFRGLTRDHNWGKWIPANAVPYRARPSIPEPKPLDSLNTADRNQYYNQLLESLELHNTDRADLVRRGLTDAEIARGQFRSINSYQKLTQSFPKQLPGIHACGQRLANAHSGYLIPIPNVWGQIVGMQYRLSTAEHGRYRWLSTPHGPSPHLPNGENPIGVYRPGNPISPHIGMAEGFLKPYIASLKLNQIIVGAAGGQFTSSLKTLRYSLSQLALDLNTKTIDYYPDAGDIANPKVIKRLKKLFKMLRSWGYILRVGWWQQVTKDHPDIDELDPQQSNLIEWITPHHFFELAQPYLARTQIHYQQRALNRLTRPPSQVLNQQYLSGIQLPQPGSVLFLSSPMGTGKTQTLTHLATEFFNKHIARKCRLLGYRNGLLRQSGERFNAHFTEIGLSHRLHLVHDLEIAHESKLTHALINHTTAVSACVDSLNRFDLDSFTGSLVILDEFDAILKHLILGRTCKVNRAQLMFKFQEILKHVVATGGYIVCSEATITNLAVDTILAITGEDTPYQLIVNQWQPKNCWDITLYDTTKAGLIQELIRRLQTGEKIIFPTDSQKFAEVIEAQLRDLMPDKKVIRVDSKTTELPFIRQLLSDPNTVIQQEQPDLLLYTPSMESGTDITLNYFTSMGFYFSNLEVRSQLQMLGRYRLPIPRWGLVKRAINLDVGSLSPVTLLKEMRHNTRKAAEILQLAILFSQTNGQDWLQNLNDILNPDQTTPATIWLTSWANFQARINGSRARMRDIFVETCTALGHQVGQLNLTHDSAIADHNRQVESTLESEEAVELAQIDPGGMTETKAQQVLNSFNTSYDQVLKAKKVVLQHRLPGVELTPAFLLKAIIHNKAKFLKATELLWLCIWPQAATSLDQNEFTHAIRQPFLFSPDLSHRRLKADLMHQLGLLDLIENREFHEQDPAIQTLKQIALKKRWDIRFLLRLQIKDSHTGIQILSKLLHKLGYDLKVIRKEGPRKYQRRIWAIANLEDEERDMILQALDRRYWNGVVTTCFTRSIRSGIEPTVELGPNARAAA